MAGGWCRLLAPFLFFWPELAMGDIRPSSNRRVKEQAAVLWDRLLQYLLLASTGAEIHVLQPERVGQIENRPESGLALGIHHLNWQWWTSWLI